MLPLIVRRLRSAGWGVLLLLWADTSAAHLLNMSRVELTLPPAAPAGADPTVRLRLELDLTRALGGSTAFHAASLKPAPLRDPALLNLTHRVGAAVDLRINGQSVSWRTESLTFASRRLADYESPAVWPRATLVLRGTPGSAPDAATLATANGLRLRLQPGFPFEEPIAVTVRGTAVTADNRPTPTMTRWLVAEQWFPALSPALLANVRPARGPGAAVSARPGNSPEESSLSTLGTFSRIGLIHVLPGGWDHLAFVLGLLLLAPSGRGLVRLLLWYTTAHTLAYLTLALRWVPAPGLWIEGLILLSIGWTGVNILRSRGAAQSKAPGNPTADQRTSRPSGWIVFSFGLVHGLGFASSLDALPLSLSGRLAAILGFTIGVDIAQLSTALVLWWGLTREAAGQPLRPLLERPIALILIIASTYYLLKLFIFSW